MNALTENITNVEKHETVISLTDPVLELVLQRVRLYAKRRIAWLRKVWMEAGNNNGNGEVNYHTEVDGYLNNMDTPDAEAAWLYADESVKGWNEELEALEDALASDDTSRLAKLTSIFNLSTAETDILHTCLAIAIEPNLSRVYAYLHDHSGKGYVTEELVARLYGHGRCLPLSPDSSLKLWALVIENDQGVQSPSIDIDPYIRNWLLGLNTIDESLAAIARLQTYKEPLSNWPVKQAVEFVKKNLNRQDSKKIRLLIAGAPGTGRRSFAGCISHHLGLSLFSIDADRVSEQHWVRTYMRAQRYAFLHNCALAWYGTNIWERYWPQSVSSFPVQFIAGEVDEFLLPHDAFLDYRFELPALLLEERLQLWVEFVPAAVDWPKPEFQNMISLRQTTIGQINDIASREIGNVAEAEKILSTASNNRLGNLAQKMNNSFSWKDLVAPGWLLNSLEDFTFEALERSHFWEQPAAQRLFPQGKGLIALFTGSPGTGKTMAAQVIAASLKLELFRIDLSSIVSKYVGETSKNIERILSRAQRMDVILLFDEADALFGKRTEIKDAHDRFANTDTNYLLQAIEQYSGIAILASNKKSNMDTGFTRRLRYVLEFPKPDMQQRLQLWQNIIEELAGELSVNNLNKDLVRLAEIIEVTGAQIKFTVLSALFIARKEKADLALSHLLRGLERELMKEGRGLGRQVNEIFKQ